MKTSMKRTVLAVGMSAALFSGFALADTSGEAAAHVYVDIVENITVGVLTGNVDMGDVQTGDIMGSLGFRVDANVETLTLSAVATKLYKGDDPSDPDVSPIGLDVTQPLSYLVPDGNPVQGGSNQVSCVGGAIVPTANGAMDAYECASVEFESSQDGHFSQNVGVELHWLQDDPELTTGEYSGWVFFTAAIL